jgi:tRNA/rRNA methyltransferase
MINEKVEIVPIMVAPLYQGNIGSVARLCRNFGMKELYIIDGPEFEDEAIAYSMHGKEILLAAQRYSTLKEISPQFDHLVGSSGISDSGEKAYQRNPMSLEEMVRWMHTITGRIGIVLGREDKGLLREELEICDVLVTIPASPDYPILNISHAAGILFYEIWKGKKEINWRNSPTISGSQRNTLLEHYEKLMDVSRVREHKKPIARTNFRRMIARAAPSRREFSSIMGTLSKAMIQIEKKDLDEE